MTTTEDIAEPDWKAKYETLRAELEEWKAQVAEDNAAQVRMHEEQCRLNAELQHSLNCAVTCIRPLVMWPFETVHAPGGTLWRGYFTPDSILAAQDIVSQANKREMATHRIGESEGGK